MPQPCTICVHEEHDAIDRALIGGTGFRDLARQYGVSRDAIARHRSRHLTENLAGAQDAKTVASATDLLTELRLLRVRANGYMLKAEKTGDIRTALAAIREARATLELLAELEGELDRRAVVNVLNAPEWVAARSAIMLALQPYPDASEAVALALAGVNGDAGR
jgi:hypothetical protein